MSIRFLWVPLFSCLCSYCIITSFIFHAYSKLTGHSQWIISFTLEFYLVRKGTSLSCYMFFAKGVSFSSNSQEISESLKFWIFLMGWVLLISALMDVWSTVVCIHLLLFLGFYHFKHMSQNGLHCWEETYCSAKELLLPTKLLLVKAVCYKKEIKLIINWRLSNLLGQKHHNLIGVHFIYLSLS